MVSQPLLQYFIGYRVPEPLADTFKAIAGKAMAGLPHTGKPEGLPHLTVKFFRNIPDDRDTMQAIIHQIADTARRYEPIPLIVDKMSYFANTDTGQVRTLTLTCTEEPADLRQLSDELQQCETILGSQPQHQTFHFTLVNHVKGLTTEDADCYIRTLEPLSLAMTIKTFSLYRCRHDGGQFFEEIARFDLGNH